MMLGLSGPGPPPAPSSSIMMPSTSSAAANGMMMMNGREASIAPSTSSYCVTNHLGPTTAPPSSDTLLLTLRSKPHSRVFRALFQYLPMRDSPNENPQLELTLQPGDVILVKGEMDSDGFYCGETLDGRTGLVPSNYVERVPDSVLLANARAPSPSFPLRIPHHLSTIAHDFSSPDHSTLPDSVCPYPPADVTKVTVQEIKNSETPRIPCPRELIVEKKLSRSALVSWSPPEESFVAVSQYHVCVDGAVRAIVPGSYKCRALVEDIPLDSSINLSVRAVTEHGHSPDACCTISIGNEAAVAPQQVRVWAVTPVSACVRWYPSNSNAEHVVSLNAVKVGVCPPTVFQVQLQGLQPSTIYRVSVRTKHPKAVLEQRPVERCIDFKTLPKIGLPDPPSHVQVEIGPQPGTLLVSWQPVANQPKPPSRAAVHSYLIYADGKNIAQVPSASADHVVLRLADLSDDPPIFITVRTKTKEGAVSSDSNVSRVPRTSTSTGLPILQSQSSDPSLQLVDMTSSYPSYGLHHPHQISNSTMFVQPTAVAQPMTNGHSVAAPYTAPARLVGATGLMTYQQPSYPSTMLQSGGVVQPAAPTSVPPPTAYATFDRSASLGAAPTLVRPATAVIPNAWKSSQMSQYYTFHPNFLHTEPTAAEDNRPSVLEMENSYLMRHRQSDWSNAPESRDARARIEAYSRGLARAGSADERCIVHTSSSSAAAAAAGTTAGGAQIGVGGTLSRLPGQRLIAPRLARVKSESGFGTRSEPDLRPPTLDDDNCRWFVALFDYSHHMSPNANAEFEELSFRKHQLIKVYGEADADGFYQGQIGNRVGLVPSNMVIEIAKDDVLPRRSVAAAAAAPIPTANVTGAEPALRRMRWGSLKSRSYDHAGDRSTSQYRAHQNYASLDRRDDRDRIPPPEVGGRYRRGASSYDYRRSGGGGGGEKDYDDPRYPRERASRRQVDPRDDYGQGYEDDGYRDKYRIDRERERERYDRDRRDRGGYDDRRYRDQYPQRDPDYREKYRERPRMDDSQRDYDYPPRFDQPSTSQMATNQLNHQMSQMQLGGASGGFNHQQQQQPQQQMIGHQQGQQSIIGIPSSSGIGGMGGAGISAGGAAMMQDPNSASGGMMYNGVSGGGGGGGGSGMMNMKKMVAKFDYDSRQLSPNVDAEQVELSFRQGDIITVYGDMDEDGFFMGELNGVRGLVPSNFLQSSPLNQLGPSQPMEPMMRKGVAFSDTAAAGSATAIRKTAPVRQTSQTSQATIGAGASVGGGVGGKPAAKKSIAGQATGKPLAKKTSDVGKSAAPNARKTSTAVKKSDVGAKKK